MIKSNTLRQVITCFLIMLMGLMLSGCMPGDGSRDEGNLAGLLSGIWHGWIAPLSLIGGLVNGKIRIYEIYNNGWPYDFGFYIAIIGGFGGLSIVRKNRKK